MSDAIATLLIEPDARQRPGSSASATTRPSGAAREFLLGPENRLVSTSIGLEIGADQRQSMRFDFVPLTIHAPSGLGKSLLLRAIAETWRRQHSEGTVLSTTGDDFARSYADAANLDDLPRFHQRYQRADLLLIDNIDLLRGKAGAQQQLARLIDRRQRRASPTVLTARKPIRLLRLSDRLISRMSGGLVVPLRLPSAATRQRILSGLCDQQAIRFSTAAERLVVERESLTIFEIFGLLNRLREEQLNHDVHSIGVDAVRMPDSTIDPSADSDRHSRVLEVGFDQVRRLLDDATNDTLTPKQIIRETARYFGLEPKNLTGTSRRRTEVLARSLAMYLIRDLIRPSFQQIGNFFGGRDHSTVIYAHRKVLVSQNTDIAMRGTLQEIRRRLHEKQVRSGIPI